MYTDNPSGHQAGDENFDSWNGLDDQPVIIDSEEDSDDPLDPSFVQMVDEMEGSDSDSIDLYAVLGVSKTATLAEIRTAYKRLSLLLHPDKHNQPTASSHSTTDLPVSRSVDAFGRVATAYAILSDPKQRAIYDNFGYKALQVQGWELATCNKSAPELRLEYLLLKEKAMEAKQLQLTQPSSEFSLGLDLTDTFDRYLNEPPEDRTILPIPTIYQLSLAQSVTAGLTLRNSVSLAGQVTAHNGLGVGTCILVWRHHCRPKSLLGPTTIDSEVSYGRAGRGLGVGLRFRRGFGQRYVAHMGLSLSSTYARSPKSFIALIPGASIGLNVQLLPKVNARIELRSLSDPGISTELLWSSENNNYFARVSAKLSPSGRTGIAIRLEKSVSWAWLNPPKGSGIHKSEDATSSQPNPEWAPPEEEEDPNARIPKQGTISGSVDVNTQDLVEFGIGVQCCISSFSRLFGFLTFSLRRGVTLKLSLLRGTQTYSFPFLLSHSPNKIALGYGLFVPVFVFAIIRTLLLEPYLTRQLERAQSARRAKLREDLTNRRREALATQSLMRMAALRNRESESQLQGLIILRATFGLLGPTPQTAEHLTTMDEPTDAGGQLTLDVTVPLQTMVEHSQLRLPPGRWSDLQGFYDPCLGLNKVSRQLRVLYSFHGQSHEVIVLESQGLAIPMSKHRIETLEPL